MRNWSEQEAQLIVADYFDMLIKELQGRAFNKSEHRKNLGALLSGRTDGSIERKHQNISAILIELGFPAIDGYKPLKNYQSLLFDVVLDRLSTQEAVTREALLRMNQPVHIPEVEDILSILEPAPKRGPTLYPKQPMVKAKRAAYDKAERIDFFELEMKNTALGNNGEEFVLRYEKARLIHAGREELADRLEQVSKSQGPSAGFDIRSFENNGKDRLIEVKTTSYGRYTPFYITKNELRTSIHHPQSYHLYRLFLFRSKPGLFTLSGQIDKVCFLDPVQYLGKIL